MAPLHQDEIEDLKQGLTEEQQYVCFEKGTERPFTGKYHDHKADGMYHCVVCGAVLFDSKTKYDSGSGWPSFYAPVESDRVIEEEDGSLFMTRIEVLCSQCEAHLGHVFPDGPQPSGLRYCINSASLDFKDRC